MAVGGACLAAGLLVLSQFQGAPRSESRAPRIKFRSMKADAPPCLASVPLLRCIVVCASFGLSVVTSQTLERWRFGRTLSFYVCFALLSRAPNCLCGLAETA